MKYLILLLTLTMSFGQTELTTRQYTIDIDMAGGGTIPIDMLDVTGYDLTSAIINVIWVENNTNDNINLMWECDVIEENMLIQHSYSNIMTPPRTSVYMGNENCLIKNPSANPITNNSSLSMQITAEFPQDETPYTQADIDEAYYDGAQSGDVSGDGVLNVMDLVQYIHMILDF